MSEKVVIPPRIGPVIPGANQTIPKPASGPSFESIFNEQLTAQSGVKFSAHALKRLESREITLDQKDLTLLKEAVDKAEAKGAKESLILMDQMALVVSIRNRTVITAVGGENLKDNVFTNIDSAVIVKN